MKITAIEPQKNLKRVNIFIDGEFAFGIDEYLRFKHSLHVDDEITQEFIDKILKAEEQLKANNYAFGLLSYRQRSEKELINALQRKGFDEEYIEKSLQYLRENKYIDDEYFTKSFIADKQNLNGFGAQRIKYELIKKGISNDIIQSQLIIDEDEEYQMALEIGEKKMKSFKNDEKDAIYRKLGGFLQRRGYSYDIVSKVLRTLLKDR